MPLQPQRILLCRPDRIGDVIVSTGILPVLRARFPQANISFLVQPPADSLLVNHPGLDALWLLPKSAQALATQMREHAIDCVIHLEPNALVEEAAYVAQVPVRIGFRKFKREHLTHARPYPKRRGQKHESLYAYDLLAFLDIPEPPQAPLPSLALDPQAQHTLPQRVALPKTPFAVFHLGAHADKPRIPVPYFVHAANALAARGLSIVLVGAQKDDPAHADFLALRDPALVPVHDFSGKLTLAELGYLLQRACVYFARDTGPTHLASALGCPTVCLIFPDLPGCETRWRPLGPKVITIGKPVSKLPFESRDRLAKRFLKPISPDDVTAAILQAAGCGAHH